MSSADLADRRRRAAAQRRYRQRQRRDERVYPVPAKGRVVEDLVRLKLLLDSDLLDAERWGKCSAISLSRQ